MGVLTARRRERVRMRISLQPDSLDLSVVIPCLNEGPNLYRLLPVLRRALDALGVQWEVLVVDGASQDGTDRIVERAGMRYVCETAKGYGAAILRGFSEARGRHIVTMDADLSHPAEFIQELWAARRQGDIVIASRYIAGGRADQPWSRLMLSRILNRFFGKALAIPVKDMSSGFRLYHKRIFSKLDLEFTNFVLLVEILIKAFGKGRHVKEVPFHYAPRQSGSSHARILRFGIDYLKLLRHIWRVRNSVAFADYDDRAFDSRIPLQRYWQRKRYKIVLEFTPKFVSTADVGCGSSRILVDLPHAVGVDIQFAKLAYMRKTNDRLVQADAFRLPFPDETFECVICSEVIEHLPEGCGDIFGELTRLLAPGGTLVLGTPDYGRVWWRVIEKLYHLAAPNAYAEEHVTHYTRDMLMDLLKDRGYEILDHRYICRSELIIKARKREVARTSRPTSVAPHA